MQWFEELAACKTLASRRLFFKFLGEVEGRLFLQRTGAQLPLEDSAAPAPQVRFAVAAN